MRETCLPTPAAMSCPAIGNDRDLGGKDDEFETGSQFVLDVLG